jgi:hypothetical protein
MKRIILFFFLVFNIAALFAQNWCPTGARWHIKKGLHTGSIYEAVDGIIDMAFTTNTTVIGIPCKRLDAVFSGRKYAGPGSLGPIITEPYQTLFTYENNNVVFFYNGTNAFDTLVDFNANIGQTWLKPRWLYSNCLNRPVVKVTDTGHVVINGFNLRKIKTIDSVIVLNFDSTLLTVPEITTFVERILFPDEWNDGLIPNNCDFNFDTHGWSNFLRCYQDNVFPLYQVNMFGLGVGNCDSQTGLESIKSNSLDVVLYPNPNDGNFQIRLPLGAGIDILDALGQIVYFQKNVQDEVFVVEGLDIQPGPYIIKVKTKDAVGQVKFIRQ